jgi:class 3 adenylate cyclase
VNEPVRFAHVGSARVGFQVHGSGDIDVVYSPGLASHLDMTLEQPRYRHYIERLTDLGRVIRFDRRGTGVSDPVPTGTEETWEMWADDLSAVLDDAGSHRAVVIAANDAGPAAVLYAATHPSRVEALVLFNTTACFCATPDYPEGHPPEVAEFVVDVLRTTWGTEESVPALAPSLAADEPFRRWYARFQRGACPPGEMVENMRRVLELDCRAVLPQVQCPTLVLHREGYAMVNLEQARYLAEHISGAALVRLPGGDAPIYTEGTEDIIATIGRFLGRTPSPAETGRSMGTVLFTDIVGSTELATELGDTRWHSLLDAHDSAVRDSVAVHAGRVIKSTGDGLLAVFGAPTRGIACAFDVHRRVTDLGIRVRAGLHAGPIISRPDGDVAGLAIHIAARVLGCAGPGEVVTTSGVIDIVSDAKERFVDHGTRDLKGISAPVHLYCAVA